MLLPLDAKVKLLTLLYLNSINLREDKDKSDNLRQAGRQRLI